LFKLLRFYFSIVSKKGFPQDWQDRQFVQMAATHRDPGLGRRWLADMGSAAAAANISIQYCMTLPRELLQVRTLL
jgi:hypothetical protein